MIQIPVAGIAAIYAASDTDTTGSTGTDHVTVRALVSGRDATGISLDTASGELQAYALLFLGQTEVGAGDIIALQVTNNGAPSVPMYPDSFALRVTLTPRE